jgi:SOS-response transcriptional repressor LexA
MARNRRDIFTTIKSEGALLPPDFLQKVAEGRPAIDGLTPGAYHLVGGEKLNEAASRAWNRLLGAWVAFQGVSTDLTELDPGTSITREKWLLPLFHELGYGRLLTAKTLQIDDKPYPISHLWQHTPIHLVGRNVDLDKRSPGVAGAAKTSPHGLLQEFLNRADPHLWGFVSNGLTLRILRDNKSFTRQAYVEFDLAGMMEGQVYSDFVLLWLLCHESRVEAEPEQCWLEKWSQTAREQGTRALDQLRVGVESAIEGLGRGFLDHSANKPLVQKLRGGALTKQDYYRQLLRQVYRLIFLFVAEDRDLLLTASHGTREHQRYARFYSMARLRTLAERRRGSPHADLWHGLRFVFQKLSSDTGCTELGVPALGSFLWSDQATPDLDGCELSNGALLDAIRSLAFTTDRGIRSSIDYKNLGPEELGSVYESLLELHPEINADVPTFSLTTAAGHERKTTGSYYTPTSLIDCLLDSAVEPLLAEAATQPEPERAVLNLKVCDPACGSGHFLIAAAHRIANRLAAVRTGEEPSPKAVRQALRDTIGHCLYGVDMNPMAVELCKVNLWLEALEPGKPLSFLEHHILCGNSLLGTTPELLKNGIPNEAFEPIEGDDKTYCRQYKKKNKKEHEGQRTLFQANQQAWDRLGDLAKGINNLDALADDTLEGQRTKEERWEQLVRSNSYELGCLWADAWCAAFVWKKLDDPALPYPITEEVFQRIGKDPFSVPDWMRKEVRRLADEYQFFHWHLSFPAVFRVPKAEQSTAQNRTGWLGGFDVVLGNPPWERIKLQEKEFFAERHPAIATAANAADRGRMIKRLEGEDPALFQAFRSALRLADGESALVRRSDRYPLCGRGDINTYAIFAELNRSLIHPNGRAGFIVPTGIATDDTTKTFFQDLVAKGAIARLFGFENEERIFPGLHHAYRFCLLALTGSLRPEPHPEFAFFLRQVAALRDPQRRFRLSAEDFALLNPNTRTCPIFRSGRDAELTKAVYNRIPVLVHEAQGGTGNPWGVDFLAMFHMANDSGLFRIAEQLKANEWELRGNVFHRGSVRCLPLYEAKMIHHFDHRFGTYEGQTDAQANQGKLPELDDAQHADPRMVNLPNYWVPEEEVWARSARVPAALLKAYRARSQQMATQCLVSWLAGYHLNRGTPELGKALLLRLFGSDFDQNVHAAAMDVWLANGLAPALEREYPLTEGDIALIESADDALAAALLLLEAKCPRWFLGWRDITGTEKTRTVIASVIPRAGMGHTVPILHSSASPTCIAGLCANLSSFALDYVSRQKVGGTHLTYFFLRQFPVLPPEVYGRPAPWTPTTTLGEWMRLRILELVYTAWDLQPFARDLGYDGPPFRWDPDRRFVLRCELDAAFFQLYGIVRDDVAYVMDTFPIVRGDDQEQFGHYRTREAILELYDRMSADTEGEARRVALPAAQAVPTKPVRSVVEPFERVPRPPRDEQPRTAVPLISLEAAAGGFSEDQAPEFEDWVRPAGATPLGKGMFVAQVAGKSMQPAIPDGSYCLFQRQWQRPKSGAIVLVELHVAGDPDTGGRYTVKRYRSEGERAILEPLNPAYQPIILEGDEVPSVRVIAQVIEVLRPEASLGTR